MQLHSVNKDQRLYVMKTGSGFSCYGFNVLHEKAKRIAVYMNSKGIGIPEIKSRIGSKSHFDQCNRVISLATKYCTANHIKCPTELSEQLKGKEGRRVEVETMSGEVLRFKVGKSTGWLPVHLMLANSRSTGGAAAPREFKRITVIK